MLKRLLTAVFVLGLFMVLSGTAFSAPTDYPGEGPKSDKIYQGPTTTTVKSILKSAGFETPQQRPDVSDLESHLLTQHPVIPGAQSVDTTVCAQISNVDWANATYYISFPRQSAHNNQQMAMRYDGPSAPGYSIKVLGAYNWILRVAEGVAMDAQAGVTVRVFDDAGGLPGTELYSETFMVPTFGNQGNYLYFPFTTEVVVGGPYHISFGPDLAGPSTDTIVFTSNDAGYPGVGTAIPNGRGSQYSLAVPGWLTALAYNGSTFDPAFDQLSDQCEFYSVCYINNPLPAPGYMGHLVDIPADYWADGSTLDGVSQYFTATGPETLKTIRLFHYSYGGTYPGAFYSGTSTNSIDVMIFPDDGSGNVDYSGGPLATVNMPAGASLFPQTGLLANGYNWVYPDFSSFNLVLFGGYHVAVQMTSTNPADGVLLFPLSYETAGPSYTDGTGGSVNYTAPGVQWQRMFANTSWMSDPGAAYGIDYAFSIRPTLCKDEFSLCESQPSYMVGAYRLLYMDNCNLAPFYGSRNGIAGKFSGGQVNRVDKVRFQLTDETYDTYPDVPNSVKVTVFSSVGGAVGASLWSTVLTNAQLTYLPGWTEVVIPGGVIAFNEFFVGVEPLFTLDGDNEWLYFARERVADPGVTALVRGGMWVKLCADNLWYENSLISLADNFVCEADFCSIPPTDWTCGVADDYPTNAHDYGRTGHSNVALSDAYCDLNIKWTFTDPNFGSDLAGGGAIASNAPIIYDTFVVCVQNSKINILSLNDGAVLATLTGNVAPYYMAVSLNRSTPTIQVIDVGGTPKPVMFYGGGNTIVAVMMEVGFPVLWDLTSTNRAAKGYPAGSVTSGFSNYLAPVVANVGGDDKLFFATGNSQVYSADAETGMMVWGPTTLVSNPVRNLAFDGTDLYTATIAAPPFVLNGDVYSIDATTGLINWQLSSAVGGGLKGAVLRDTVASDNESFADQLAVSDGEVWTVSAYYTPESVQDEGVLYNINAATGAVDSYSRTQHFYQGGGLVVGANLMVDAARIVVAGGSTWTSTPYGGTMIAHNRFTGSITWVSDAGSAKTTSGNFGNGFMTCEATGPDNIYMFGGGGYLSCFNGETGSEIFSRRIDYLSLGFTSRGAGGAISKDGIAVFGTYAGQLIALEKGLTDRGRLEIMDYTPTSSVSFGASTSIPIVLPNVYTNTGCATVTGSYTISLTSNGALPGVSEWSGFDVIDRTASIADQMTVSSIKAFKGSALVAVDMGTAVDETVTRTTLSRAALAVPVYLNNVATTAFVVNPLDTFDIPLDVNQTLIPRGPNRFYITFDSDDPDFFLNNITADPEIMVTLVGGCLIDTTHLLFGAGSANLQAVANSGRLGTGDWNPTPGNIKIAGDAVSFYQGTYVYGVSRSRIALNSQDWWSGGGEADSWISMQGDPDPSSQDCKPVLVSPVSLGSASLDGFTYTGLSGNMVTKQYVDSVLIYDPDGSAGPAAWNWLNFETAYFDTDSTMGLYVSTSTFGVVDAPLGFEALNDVSVEVMKFKTRNGQMLNNWKFGCGIDYDVVNPDTTGIDRSISTVYTYGADGGATARKVWGIVKLPFGPGYEPIKSGRALARAQSMTTPSSGGTARGNGFADSSYFWMSLAPSGTSQGSMHAADDQDAFATIAEHSFTAGGDSIQFAVAHFARMLQSSPSLGSNYASLAKLLNQWMGFGRGDVNNDGAVNIADIIYLAENINAAGPGPIPFAHLGDVDGDGLTGPADLTYMINYYFHFGPAPVGEFIIQ